MPPKAFCVWDLHISSTVQHHSCVGVQGLLFNPVSLSFSTLFQELLAAVTQLICNQDGSDLSLSHVKNCFLLSSKDGMDNGVMHLNWLYALPSQSFSLSLHSLMLSVFKR